MPKKLVILYHPKKDDTGEVHSPPYALLSIASLTEDLVDIEIVEGSDVCDFESHIPGVIKGRELLAVGVTVITGPPIADAYKFSCWIKENYPQSPVIWGGYHASIDPEGTLQDEKIDMVIAGQGEVPFFNLITALVNGTSIKEIAGLGFKKNGEVVVNQHERPRNVNEFPPYPYHLIDIKKYIISFAGFGLKGSGIVYITSQGCPFDCKFCANNVLYRRRWSGFDVERMISEIKKFKNEYGISSFMIFDDNFFVNVKRSLNFAQRLVDEKLNIKWYSDIRIDQINRFKKEELKLLKQAGAEVFLVGAESGNLDILGLVNKQITPDDTIKAATVCQEAGINIIYSIMTGFPDNYKEEFRDTISLINTLRSYDNTAQILLCSYTPYPGTELFRKYKNIVKVPDTLFGWSRYSLLNVNNKWYSRRHAKRIKNSMFYIDVAYSKYAKWKVLKKYADSNWLVRLFYTPFRNMAIWRLNNQHFSFNIEETLFKTVFFVVKKLSPNISQKLKNEYE